MTFHDHMFWDDDLVSMEVATTDVAFVAQI